MHFNFESDSRGGVRVWSKEAGLGPAAVGLHGFKPHPPHFILIESLKLSTSEKSGN